MIIDRSVCPDVEPPTALTSPAARADYVHPICAVFDYGIFPEETGPATTERIVAAGYELGRLADLAATVTDLDLTRRAA